MWCSIRSEKYSWYSQHRASRPFGQLINLWCGVALMVRRGSFMVRRGSVGSASACWKAGPSSILGSAPQGGFSPLSTSSMRKWREASANGDGWMYHCMNVISECMYWKKDKINKKCGNRHQTFKNLLILPAGVARKRKVQHISIVKVSQIYKKTFCYLTSFGTWQCCRAGSGSNSIASRSWSRKYELRVQLRIRL
jgi:hypothetical protein